MDLLFSSFGEAFSGVSSFVFLFAIVTALAGGLVKGIVGFAMPTVMISGLGSIVAPDIALAWLILPTLMTNLWQLLRQGIGAALMSLWKFRVFLGCCMVVLALAAQLVAIMPGSVMLLTIGIAMTAYALSTLLGFPLRLPSQPSRLVEAQIGSVAGFFGGISGTWGPPTVALLTAMNTEKTEQMRVQGVIYGIGAIILLGAHLVSGVFNAQTAPVSAVLVLPAVLGIWIGFNIQDRVDQATFRKLTLIVLLIAGLNLVRRGFFAF